MKKFTNKVLIMTISFMVLVSIIGFMIYKNNVPKNLVCGTPDPPAFCGTQSNLTDNGREGKQIFNINCAACHMLKRNMTGPALSEMDSIKMREWLTHDSGQLDSTKYGEMGIDYHKNLWGKTLNEKEIGQLIEYSWTK
jgi:hypothetical protein